MAKNPLAELLRQWMPAMDVAILEHGFAGHGRDYDFVVQDNIGPRPGTYRLTLTHVVDLKYETRVRDDVWPVSWSDDFIDYEMWQSAGEPSGYVWGTDWSLAYPGFEAPSEDETARHWSNRLGQPMHVMSVETDRFRISMIFHDVRVAHLSTDTDLVSRLLVPMPSKP